MSSAGGSRAALRYPVMNKSQPGQPEDISAQRKAARRTAAILGIVAVAIFVFSIVKTMLR